MTTMPGGRLGPLEVTCEKGHHYTPKADEAVSLSMRCPCPVFVTDGRIAVLDNPFDHPGVEACGAGPDYVSIDIFDYVEGRR